MSSVNESDIHDALRVIKAADEAQDIIAAERVQGLVIKDGNIGFSLDVGGLNPDIVTDLKEAAEQAVRAVKGVLSVTCVMTAHRDSQAPTQEKSKPAQEPNR